MSLQTPNVRSYKKSWNVYDRLRDAINFTDTCWLWTAHKNNRKYGVAWYNGKQWLAHRLLYVLMIGEIPAGMELDHLCRVRGCVNPGHLEPVTNRINVLRGAVSITSCPQGHKYSPSNTYLIRGYKRCRACHRAESRERRRLRKDISDMP